MPAATPKGLTRARRTTLNETDRRARRELHMQVMNKDLDRLRNITGSDAITALILGVQPSKISAVRKLRQPLPPMQAVKLARAVDANIIQALCLSLAATARSDEARNFWLDFATGKWP